MNDSYGAERDAARDWNRMEGYMALRQSFVQLDGTRIGQAELSAYFSDEEVDNWEGFSRPAYDWLEVGEDFSEDSSIVEMLAEGLGPQVSGREATLAENAAFKMAMEAERAEREYREAERRRQRQASLKFHIDLEKAAEHNLRVRLWTANTKAEVLAVGSCIANFEATLPEWFQSRLFKWLSAEIDRAYARVTRPQPRPKPAKRGPRELSGMSEIHAPKTEAQQIEDWLRHDAPRSTRWNGALLSFLGLQPWEQREVARAALGLVTPRMQELGPRLAPWLHLLNGVGREPAH